MIPIYIGAGDEANQGLCTGTENYWCVNNQADEADIQATLDFINWCVTSELGTKTMADDMGIRYSVQGRTGISEPVCKTGYCLHCRRQDSGIMELQQPCRLRSGRMA